MTCSIQHILYTCVEILFSNMVGNFNKAIKLKFWENQTRFNDTLLGLHNNLNFFDLKYSYFHNRIIIDIPWRYYESLNYSSSIYAWRNLSHYTAMINYDSMRITTYLTICYVHFKKISLHSSPRLKPNGMSFSYAKIDFILNKYHVP